MTEQTTETNPDAASLVVACSDCHAPVGTPCIGQLHAVRRETAQIRATMVEGRCTYPHPGFGPCGRRLVAYTLDGTTVAVHPDPVDAEACPPIPDPVRDLLGWSTAINLGLQPGRPGVEHFRALAVCPECAQGKHRNCTGWAMTAYADDAGRITDEMIDCECPEPHIQEPPPVFPHTTGTDYGSLYLPPDTTP